MQKTPEVFDARNEQKKKIEFLATQSSNGRIGEFWRYREGVNIGNEISKDGKFMRVCFVLQNDLGNGLLLVAPITTKHHAWMADKYVEIHSPEKYGLKPCRVLLNQIKLIDTKRLINLTWVYNPHLKLVPIVLKKYISLITKKITPSLGGKE